MSKEFIYGIHPVEAALKKNPGQIQELFMQPPTNNKRLQAIKDLAIKKKVEISIIPRAELNQRSKEANHQGVIASIVTVNNLKEDDMFDFIDHLTHPALLLILDEVQDPHNLGACLRSADAAGVDLVIAPRDKAVSITPIVRKVACGAAETLPFVQVTNLARTMRELQQQGIWFVGTAHDAPQSLYDIELTGPIAFVLGGEGKGMRRLTREACDYLVKIPMQGSVSSLNISVAAGVCLFEARRQRENLQRVK